MKRSCIAAVGLALVASAAAKRGLLLVDVQDCFTSLADGTRNGTLSVAGAIDIVPIINSIRAQKGCLFDKVFLSQDFHPTKHISFASTHNVSFSNDFSINAGTNTIQLTCLKPTSNQTADASCCLKDTAACAQHGCSCDASVANPACPTNGANTACSTCTTSSTDCFTMTQSLWPDHCLQGGDSGFVSTLTTTSNDVIIQKGSNQLVDAYSAFMDNTKNLQTALHTTLQANGITELYIAGIATDFCVSWSITDAITLGYDVKWISDASKGIVSQSLSHTGLCTVTSADVLAMNCSSPTVTCQEAGQTVSSARPWSGLLAALAAVVVSCLSA